MHLRRAVQQFAETPADHGSHSRRRVRRQLQISERLVQGDGDVFDGVHQCSVEIEDDGFRRHAAAMRAREAAARMAAMFSA